METTSLSELQWLENTEGGEPGEATGVRYSAYPATEKGTR